MVCIQCYLPPILFMIYMKVLHPFIAPYLEPALDKVISWIWGPQAVTQGCPIRAGKGKAKVETGDASQQPSTSGAAAAATSTTSGDQLKTKDD